MTGRRILGALVVALGLASSAAAQTQTYYHPGKVVIGSTAVDALTVGGRTITNDLISAVVDAGVGTVTIAGTFARTGATTSSTERGVGVVFRDEANQTLVAGIEGYRENSAATFNGGLAFYANNSGAGSNATTFSGMTERMRITPAGQILIPNGSASVPAIAFKNAPTAGFFVSGSSDVNVSSGGLQVARFSVSGGAPLLESSAGAFGTGLVTGATFFVGSNTSGADAPGCLGTGLKGGNTGVFWVDSTGVMRVNTGLGISACPNEAGGDVIGTVVGTQTSSRATKNILGQVNGYASAAMGLIRTTPIFAFTYKSGAYNGETFYGVTTDDSPLFGMDGGKSFNPVTAFGVTVLALQDTDRRIQALEAQLARALAEIDALKKGSPR